MDMLKLNFGPDGIQHSILIIDFKIIFYNNSVSNAIKCWGRTF